MGTAQASLAGRVRAGEPVRSHEAAVNLFDHMRRQVANCTARIASERLLNLLDQGKFTATYKYAALLALLDLCLETVALMQS